MTGRASLRVVVHEWDEGFEVPATDFIRQMSDLLETVPPEFRAGTIVEFDRHGSDHDYAAGEISMYYSRPETDEEMQEREKRAKERSRRAEATERAELARLKAKFER